MKLYYVSDVRGLAVETFGWLYPANQAWQSEAIASKQLNPQPFWRRLKIFGGKTRWTLSLFMSKNRLSVQNIDNRRRPFAFGIKLASNGRRGLAPYFSRPGCRPCQNNARASEVLFAFHVAAFREKTA